MNRLVKKLIRHFAIKLGVFIYELRDVIAHETLPKFANAQRNLKIDLPRRIKNPQRIFLGDDISLGPGTLLMATTHYPGSSMRHPNKNQPIQHFDPKITIGDRVTSTADLQIAAVTEIIIEEDVMFASNVHINDSLHGYENATEAYKYQGLFRIAPISIKKGCWIGQNVIIFPGVRIGKFCIVGSNSVVTNSLPDQCIAVGNPAKVIKSWDQTSQEWLFP
jgi:acetyltransferase-like isoleucine patch superfamily enzyme